MQNSSFKLTNKEFELILETEYPLLKKNAIEKTQVYFQHIAEKLIANTLITSKLNKQSYKISKGENYVNLPYLVLDLPKIEGNNFPILCRTMFWWGKYFSFNVFIRKDDFDTKTIFENIRKLNDDGIYLLKNEQIWQQDLDNDDYIPLSKNPSIGPAEHTYLKLSKKHALQDWEELDNAAETFYEKILASIN